MIVQNANDNPYVVDSVPVEESRYKTPMTIPMLSIAFRSKKRGLVRFRNAIHEGYSDLNGLEKEFALALDKTKKSWCRNPSQGGYEIPLRDHGNTRTFNPDFIVWVGKKNIIAVDTKGDHLIVEDAGRKLFHIEAVAPGPKVSIRLVTKGHWTAVNGQPNKKKGKPGYTVWKLKHGKLHAATCKNAAVAALTCLQG